MIQLAFEPAYDPYHSAFRILRQAVFKAGKPIAIPRLKINDVYIAEPRRCADIRLSGELKTAARKAATCQPPIYGQRLAATNLYDRMKPMQDAAIQTLVTKGILSPSAFDNDQAVITDYLLPKPLLDRVQQENNSQTALMQFLMVELEEIPFDGPKGLKDRTGLSEYRYDIV